MINFKSRKGKKKEKNRRKEKAFKSGYTRNNMKCKYKQYLTLKTGF